MENNFFIWRECVKKWSFPGVELTRYVIVGRMLFLWFIFKRPNWESFIRATEAIGRTVGHTGITSLEVLLCARNCWRLVHLLSHCVTWRASLRPFLQGGLAVRQSSESPPGLLGFSVCKHAEEERRKPAKGRACRGCKSSCCGRAGWLRHQWPEFWQHALTFGS